MNNTKRFYALVLFGIILSTFAFTSCSHNHSYGSPVTTKPSCFTDGAIYSICTTCGHVNYDSYIKATGHTLTEWKNNIRFLNSTSVCSECGLTITRSEYTPPNDIPQLFFYGEPQGVEIPIKLIYADVNGNKSEYIGTTRYDSNTDNLYYKRDYDFTVLDSEGFENTVIFDEKIGHFSKYTLKAEYIDKSYVRNLALSDIWSDVVRSRRKLDVNIKRLPNLGAEKGIPVIFYTNDNFKGFYTLCTPNDQSLFNMKNQENQALIYTYTDFSTFDFRYDNSTSSKVECTIIWPVQDESASNAKKSFLDFVSFVNTSDDNSFKNSIHQYLDVDAVIDYLICVYAFGADENTLDYCNWATFNGKKWIPSMYNLTYTLGLDSDHTTYTPDESFAPAINEDGRYISGTDSYLFDRIINLYYNQIKERYTDLRMSALSEQNIFEKLNYYSSLVSEEVDIAEIEEYPEKKYFNTIDSVQDILNWYSGKISILDNFFNS